MKRFLISSITAVMFLCFVTTGFANGCPPTPTNIQGQAQGQIQGQLQGQIQGQLQNAVAINGGISNTISNPDKITTTIQAAPGTGGSLYTELPVYVGPYPEAWNVQSESLNYLLTRIRTFTVNKKSALTFWHSNYTKSEITTIADNEYGNSDKVKVFCSVEELRGIKTKVMAIVVTHGNRKNTTLDCFDQALVDTSEAGGNAILILKTGSDPGVHSTTIGFGGSGAGNFSQTGTEAFSGGTATGFSSNTGGPVSNPHIHGVALRILE